MASRTSLALNVPPSGHYRRPERHETSVNVTVVEVADLWWATVLLGWATVLGGRAPETLPVPHHDPAQVRGTAKQILGRPEFRPSKRSWWSAAIHWVLAELGRLLDRLVGIGGGSGVGAWVAVAVLIAIVAVAVMLAARYWAPLVRDPSRPLVDLAATHGRSAVDWRAEAVRHEREGRWRDALRCRYRALVADLAGRGVVEEVPGRTAGEYRSEMQARAPGVATEFAGATESVRGRLVRRSAHRSRRPSPFRRARRPSPRQRVAPSDVTAASTEASAGAGPSTSARLRAAWPWFAVLAAVIAGAALVGNPGSKGPPLDPSATSPQGAKALRLLLEQQGSLVTVSSGLPPGSPADVVLVLSDQLDASRRADLLAWVNGEGHTLVVADPSSELAGVAGARAPGPGGPLTVSGPLTPQCAEPALAGVGQIDPAASRLLRVPAGAEGCFTVDGAAYMVVRKVGGGTVVALGGPAPWINADLGMLDNAVLAADLLAPTSGTRIDWLNGTVAGGGRRSLRDLVPGRVDEALVQLAVAFVLLALWRGRRLGRPVAEHQPVALPGSELVVAVGNLLQQGHRIDQAASIVRADLARRLAERIGAGAGTRPDILAATTAARTGLERNFILSTLAGPAPADEAGLVALAQAADSIRQEVAHVR